MIRVWLAHLTGRLRWSNPQRAARLLSAFARAERSSHYDLLSAANHCDDLARRALYIEHARDEALHAQMFALRARELSGPCGTHMEAAAHVDFEDLFQRLGELRFLAFVHRGELRGLRQLSVYRDELKARGESKTRAMLDAILRDEARHAAYTRRELLRVAGSERELGRALAVARRWELWRSWRRMGSGLATLSFDFAMRLLYLCLAPLAWLEQRAQRRG